MSICVSRVRHSQTVAPSAGPVYAERAASAVTDFASASALAVSDWRRVAPTYVLHSAGAVRRAPKPAHRCSHGMTPSSFCSGAVCA